MQNPNFLILDEPTNDLDIITLNVLEEYLKSFAGCVIVVSHDRFFMDKIVDHLFIFEGDGLITDFPGNYTIYRNKFLEEKEKSEAKNKIQKPATNKQPGKENNTNRKKLSFNEKREFEQLENEIAELEEQKAKLEELLNSGSLPHDELFAKSEELGEIKSILDEKEFRWLELSEKEG
jgi:ATP-binding cassette subfamily F protein uup